MYIFQFGVVITGDGAKRWSSLQGWKSRKNVALPHFASHLSYSPLMTTMEQRSTLLHPVVSESLLTQATLWEWVRPVPVLINGVLGCQLVSKTLVALLTDTSHVLGVLCYLVHARKGSQNWK